MKFILRAVAVLAALALPGKAFAHAVSIGYANAGSASVNIWLGTYSHGAGTLEGSLNLVGVLGNAFPSTTTPFSMLTANGVANKPAGLIDGTTNFYSDPFNPLLVGSEAAFNAACPACGPVQHWQGVHFTGLAVGSYRFTYVPIAAPSQEWTPYTSNLNGIFDLTGVVNPVPEPASLLLLGTGLVAVVSRRFLRRDQSNHG